MKNKNLIWVSNETFENRYIIGIDAANDSSDFSVIAEYGSDGTIRYASTRVVDDALESVNFQPKIVNDL